MNILGVILYRHTNKPTHQDSPALPALHVIVLISRAAALQPEVTAAYGARSVSVQPWMQVGLTTPDPAHIWSHGASLRCLHVLTRKQCGYIYTICNHTYTHTYIYSKGALFCGGHAYEGISGPTKHSRRSLMKGFILSPLYFACAQMEALLY